MSKNYIWSTQVQSLSQLDNSREIKFRDDRKDLYMYILGLKPGMTIADIGCGPGTLTRKLAKWLGKSAKIIGIDRDNAFIDYACRKASELGLEHQLDYLVGDALDIPLEDNCADAVTSHTVIEHVPNKEFLLEQQRICKVGGRVSVQSVRPEQKIATSPGNKPTITKEEELLWNKIDDVFNKSLEDNNIRKYEIDPLSLPKLFEELGFINIQVDTITFPIVIDDDRYNLEEKKWLINAERIEVKEAAINGFNMLNDRMCKEELDLLLNLIDERYDERIEILLSGKKLWDYEISPLLIVSGEKA